MQQFISSNISEFLHHSNITFHENGTATYIPVRYSIPVPELSISDPNKDIITTVNIPLIGLSSAAADISTFAALGMSTLAKSTHSRPFVNLTVHDYLWGYEDRLISLANGFLPNVFHFSKIGILDRVGGITMLKLFCHDLNEKHLHSLQLFDEGQNRVTMNLPSSTRLSKPPSEEEQLQQVKSSRLQETTTKKVASSLALNDVEYDEDYFTFEHFNGIETNAQTSDKLVKGEDNNDDDIETLESELERRKHSVREYSIDSWNGSPGLTQWGYSKNSET